MANQPVGKPGGTTGAVGQGPTGPADKQVVKDEKQAEERYQAGKVPTPPSGHSSAPPGQRQEIKDPQIPVGQTKPVGEPGKVLDPQPESRRGEGKVLDPSGPRPEQGADNADTGVDLGKVQSAPGSRAEDKLLGKPGSAGGQLGSKAGPPLLREADADDFALALKNVIGPLPSPKQWEVQKLFEAFMDYALRGAESFQSALRSKYP